MDNPIVRTNLAATYETQEELQEVIKTFDAPGEQRAAALMFLLTWNFCARQFDLALEEVRDGEDE
mgnify:FL=1